MKKYILLNLSALFTLFLAACMFISCGKSKKSKPSEEGRRQPKPSPFANPCTDNPFARSKKKANRMKCASNLGQITKAMIALAGDHGAFPWHLHPQDKKEAFGKGNPEHLGTIFAHPLMKSSLYTPKMLLSPCDPIRKPDNQKAAAAGFESYDARENKPIPHAAISYGLCIGGDDQLGETILGLTRNVSSDDLKGVKFLGNVMSGLKAHQGQMSRSDGSVTQVSDPEYLAESITVHTKAKGGNAPGPPSTKLMLPK